MRVLVSHFCGNCSVYSCEARTAGCAPVPAQIMADTLKDPVIKRCCEAPNRLADLQHVAEGLERSQKSLNDYLDSKRNAFPRFFFISDDELLSILGSSDPLCVQEHMIKVRGPGGGARGDRGGRPAPRPSRCCAGLDFLSFVLENRTHRQALSR